MTALTVAIAVAMWLGIGVPRRRARDPVDAALAGRLVLIGLRSGLSPHAALADAARIAPPGTAKELRLATHHATTRGFSAAADRSEALAGVLRVIGRASDVGAPVVAELASFLAAEAEAGHQLRLARAKSLPVRLAVPLTLLVLPGVILLTVGPSLLGTLSGLADPDVLLP